ncbi:unnamed protein product, partial [marine sediment metagenome]
MRTITIFFSVFLVFCLISSADSQEFENDIIKTSKGDLKLTFIGHGTLMFSFDGKVIHIDPISHYADYKQLPKADLILITHEHGDHLDPTVIEILCKEDTDIVLTEKCLGKFKGGMVMKNGETKTIKDIMIEAIPAYNIKHMRSPNNPFHPRGDGNGYILTLADKKIYVAGDTENTPEMKALKDIDIAFLPMNLPYTMTPEMVAD